MRVNRTVVQALIVVLVVCLLAYPVLAADCTKCGKQLKWGWGTCADCKRAGIERLKPKTQYCNDCGTQLKWGVGTCADCKRKAIERVKPKAGDCTSCGRQLKWGVGTCADCKRKAIERLKPETQNCTSCGRQLKWGVGTCADCKKQTLVDGANKIRNDPRWKKGAEAALDLAQKVGRNLTPEHMQELADVLNSKFTEYGPVFKEKLALAFARTRGELLPKLASFVEQHGPRLKAVLTDPENWDRAVGAVAVAMEIHHRIEVLKDNALANTLELVGNQLTFNVNGQKTTANEWAGQVIAKKFPCLEGTSLAEEPLQAFVYIFVATDPKYLANELKIIKTGGGAISATEAISRASASDADGILDALEVVNKTMRFRRGLATGEDVISSGKAFTEMIGAFAGGRR